MLEDQSNTMIFLWEIYSIFMQIYSIVLVLQHGIIIIIIIIIIIVVNDNDNDNDS